MAAVAGFPGRRGRWQGPSARSSPFWSPDSRSIGFFADTKLKRMDIDGGSVQTLASDAPAPLGGTWNSDGTILFSTNPGGPIFRISAEGGEPSAATRFESPQQRSHSFPQFLPDGRHFLFFVTGSPEARGVYVGQLDGLDAKRLFDADAPAVYAATGHLLFIREGTAVGARLRSGSAGADGRPVSDGRTRDRGHDTVRIGRGADRLSHAFGRQRPAAARVGRSVRREIDKVVYPDTASTRSVAFTRWPPRRRVPACERQHGHLVVRNRAAARGTGSRLTPATTFFRSGLQMAASIVFGSTGTAAIMNLYRKLLSAPPGSEELLLSTPQPKFPTDWSPDGRFLLYDSLDPKRGFDIWALPLEGDRKPFEVVQTDFNERLAQFSPDGKWIAYQSDKTGRFEIYVQPFPGPGGDSRVSIDGGAQVRWNPNGKELFYIAPDDRLMAVPIRFASNGKAVEPGTPLGLFATNVGSTAINTNRQQYAVSPDGQSFVMNSVLGEASASPITVILNWSPEPGK